MCLTNLLPCRGGRVSEAQRHALPWRGPALLFQVSHQRPRCGRGSHILQRLRVADSTRPLPPSQNEPTTGLNAPSALG